MNDMPKETGAVVAMILVGDTPGASYKVELPGKERDTIIELSDAQEEYWALANTIDFVAGDWEDGAVFMFGRTKGETLCRWCTKAIPTTTEGRSIRCPHCGSNNPFNADAVQTETIIHHWSREHGDCLDCGNPAAYVLAGQSEYILCSVCAATHAADGEPIMRIEDAVHTVYLITWEGSSATGFFSIGTLGIPEAYDMYFAEVRTWITQQMPAALRLVAQVVSDDMNDDQIDPLFKSMDLMSVVRGEGGTVLVTTGIEAG